MSDIGPVLRLFVNRAPGHLEVDTQQATVPLLSTCDGHMTGHWPVAVFKRWDRR